METPEERYDEWWSDTHGGTGEFELEGDVDEVEEDDDFNDPESF